MLKKFSKKQLCTYPFLLSALSAGIAAFVRIKNPYVWIENETSPMAPITPTKTINSSPLGLSFLS